MHNSNKQFEGIILAAGLSMRMNEWKPEIKINGIPIIIYTINSMIPFCEHVIIVGGFNYTELNELVDKYFSSLENKVEKVRVVENKEFLNGMYSSVKCGLKYIDEKTDGIFILPGDMPFVNNLTYFNLILNFDDLNYDVLIPVVRLDSVNGKKDFTMKKGHPVLVREKLVESILGDGQETIFRNVLKNFKQKLVKVEDEGICFDIDNSDDLIKANNYFNKIIFKREQSID